MDHILANFSLLYSFIVVKSVVNIITKEFQMG